MNALPPTTGTSSRPAATCRELVMLGLAPEEAANVTAVLAGIRIATQPWTVNEIAHLLFLRAMNERGRFGPDDGAG